MNKNLFNKKKSKLIFDLGIHPYADTFLEKKHLNKAEPIYPLRCYLNLSNGLIFNDIVTSSEERYNLYDYSYTSSNSTYSRNYWRKYSNYIDLFFKKKREIKILEVGSNDGFLLKKLKNKGYKIYGVDASKHMVKIALKNKIKTFKYVFNKNNSKKIKKKTGKVNLIIANNVFNHSNDPIDFIIGVENLLKDFGYFIVEVPYWKKLVQNNQFDQIYHEHITYLTAKSFLNLIKYSNLKIIDILETEYHGGSIRFVCKKLGFSNKKVINKFLKEENELKLFKEKTYKNIMNKIIKSKFIFVEKLINLKKRGYKIVGIGAAAKANTLINFLNLDNNLIDFITEASPYKIGKFTPLSRIPIKNDKAIKKIKSKFYAIIFSWNISGIIKKKLVKINKKIKFIDFKA